MTLEDLESMAVSRQTISHLPRSSRKYLSEREEKIVDSTRQSAKNQRLRKEYDHEKDYADLSVEPGADVGFEVKPAVSPWEQFDMKSVSPQYRPFVRKLIEDHEELFATSDLDCGDISLTLGTYSLPLKKPLPHTSHRTYFLQGKKQQALKVILSIMLRHGLLRRVKSATFSSPVFIISKKDKNCMPRLLADVRQLNSHLMPVHQLVPKIQSLIEDVGTYRPTLFTSMDLASAFFSMVPDRRTEKMLTLSTQFGLFAARVGVQGVSHIPTLFSDFVYRALHNDLNGMPDPISLLLGYLDDVLAFSPISSRSLTAYSRLEKALRKHHLASDKDDPEYAPLSDRELATAYDHFCWLT